MVKYSNESEYELMELKSLFELKDSRLLVATIISINRTELTAAIQIEEACPDLEGKSLTAVEFYYHCEYSTGTIEDLADGHKAFQPNDEVYVLYAPANEAYESEERFYIVGHFDYRKTVLCLNEEYLVVTLSFTLYTIDYSFVTIFDTLNACTLNLEDFENKVGSPAKPAQLPTYYNQAFGEWLAYNFTSPLTGSISGLLGTVNVTVPTDYFFAGCGGSIIRDNSSYSSVPYTGHVSAPCADFNYGNGLRSYSNITDETCEDGFEVYDKGSYNFSNVSKITSSGLDCVSYWKNFNRDDSGHTYGASGLKIIIAYIQVYEIYVHVDYSDYNYINYTATGDTTEIETTGFTFSSGWHDKYFFDWTSLSRENVSLDFSLSATGSGALPLSPTFDVPSIEIPVSISYESIPQSNFPNRDISVSSGEIYKFYPWWDIMSSISKCVKVGYFWIYSLFGVTSLSSISVSNESYIASYISSGFNPYPAMVNVSLTEANEKYVLTCKADTCVTSIFNDLTPNSMNQVNILDCVRKSSIGRAKALNSTVEDLYDYTVDEVIDYSDLPTANAKVLQLRHEISGGPTATVLRKTPY